MNKELPLKRKLFINNYLNNGYNATQAYMDSGYKVEDRHIAQVEGSKILANPVIQGVIRDSIQELQESIGNVLNRTNAIQLAINSAIKDLESEDNRTRTMARDSLAKFASLGISNAKGDTSTKHLHINIPKRDKE